MDQELQTDLLAMPADAAAYACALCNQLVAALAALFCVKWRRAAVLTVCGHIENPTPLIDAKILPNLKMSATTTTRRTRIR